MEVAHLNGVRTDNRLANLSYVTRRENNHHKYAHGTMLMGDTHPRRRIDRATARAIGERLREVRSHRQVAAELGTTEGVVGQIAIGKNWRHVFPPDWEPPAERRMTPEERERAALMAASGTTQREIAACLGVTQSAISKLLKRRKERAKGEEQWPRTSSSPVTSLPSPPRPAE
jgi:DNA-binding CsgD family transcriptional regulator